MYRTIIIPTGLALFAMFFGAGNIIYPLEIGAHSGQHVLSSILGFLVTGVGVPFIGLYAVSLYQGDYWSFFNRLGKIPAFLIITFLIIIIGPLSAMPRTETVTFETLRHYLPGFLGHPFAFSLLYCFIVFLCAYHQRKVVDLIGRILSPIKLVSFFILILLGIYFTEPALDNQISMTTTFSNALSTGYQTMDLLATFFFCALAYTHIVHKANQGRTTSHEEICTMVLKASVIGAMLLSIVYIGFLYVAANHQSVLQGVRTDQMIGAIATAVLGHFGALFVCICVSFACLATAIALAEVSSRYLYTQVFREKLPRIACLSLVMVITFTMSLLGFGRIMSLTIPILNALYPALIVLCILNILYKVKGIDMVKLPFFATLLYAFGQMYLL